MRQESSEAVASGAFKPYAWGNNVVLGLSRDADVLATFSSHWAAVAACIRLTQPDFKSLGEDKPEDLEKEKHLRAAIRASLESKT